MNYKAIASLKTSDEFLSYLHQLQIRLPFEIELSCAGIAALTAPLSYRSRKIGNRFCALPMEGWDCAADGRPGELTIRRWRRMGQSGAKLIWGGEAAAVCHAGRSNPAQLWINKNTAGDLAELRKALVAAHKERFGRTDDLYIGLQLTHSGRFSKPNDHGRSEPITIYRHPVLDARHKITDDSRILADSQLDALVENFIEAAALAKQAGFDFVDIKHCHGYLLHELLSAVHRSGKYGGSLENRTRFLRAVVAGIRASAEPIDIGVRLSVFDFIPFQPGPGKTGQPAIFKGRYPFAFGGDGTGLGIDLSEPNRLMDIFRQLDIRLVCTTAGSPYYNPHIQRPALFPPCDGYLPPEDPLAGVARQINAVAELKCRNPDLLFVGCAYTYLQEWLGHVAAGARRQGMVDSVGVGRMLLSYPQFVGDLLAGRPINRKLLCRTFSDCTTAPRNGLVSGCYPLDEFYKSREEYHILRQIKKGQKP